MAKHKVSLIIYSNNDRRIKVINDPFRSRQLSISHGFHIIKITI